MNITDYHAKYFAHDLLRSSTEDGIEKISRSLFDAAVDLNPHQIEAALFALNSPLSKGVGPSGRIGSTVSWVGRRAPNRSSCWSDST